MNLKENSEGRKDLSRMAKKVFLWLLIAIYTYNLPNARVVYNYLVETIGQEMTGRVPLIMVFATGLTYALLLLISRRSLKNLLFLIPCGIIAYVIITLEPNPNKHIHIPQYVLMAWLLFAVLSMDYKSADVYILVFLLASMLGVVDELEQGIHPARFYGWSDMLVNSASALIGVLTIMGLNSMETPDYAWLKFFKHIRLAVGVIFFGIFTAVAMCISLFRVQESGVFTGMYPNWLLYCGVVFITLALLVSCQLLVPAISKKENRQETLDQPSDKIIRIVRLWVFPMLAILVYMHSMVLYVAISGIEFL